MRKPFANGAWVRVLGFAGLLAAFLHFVCFRNDPTGTLKGIDWTRKRGHTDHVAHVGETRVFPRLGLDLWRVPAEKQFRRLTPQEIARLPADVRAHTLIFPKDTHFVPGYPPDRPLVMNFAHVPRTYPPPVFLLGAPSALLYHYGLISFGASNRLFLAILALTWFAAVLTWTAWWRGSPPSILRQLLTAVVAGYTWYWMMEGFYDVCAIALASLALEAGRRERYALACLSAGFAVFMHPRLFMIAPLLVLVFLAALRAWKNLRVRERAALLFGIVLFVVSLGFAALIQATASLHAVAQPPSWVRLGAGPWGPVIGFAAVLVTLGVLLWKEASKVDAAVVLFGGLAFCSQRYLAPWYWLPMLPWAMAPSVSLSPPPTLLPLSKTAATARVLVVALFFFASNATRW